MAENKFLPRIKKSISSFLMCEDGSISKNSMFTIGTFIGTSALAAVLSTKTITADSINVAKTGGDLTFGVRGTHQHHASHTSHGSHSSGTHASHGSHASAHGSHSSGGTPIHTNVTCDPTCTGTAIKPHGSHCSGNVHASSPPHNSHHNYYDEVCIEDR